MSYQRLNEAEGQKAQMLRTISSIQGAINDINNKLNGGGGYLEQPRSSSTANAEIVNLDNQLNIANQRYINNNFSPRDKATIDSLQLLKTRLIASSSAGSSTANPTAIRQGLIDQKMKLESDLASAKSSMATIDQQLNALKATAGPLSGGVVLSNGNQQEIVQGADIAARDYADVQQRYEQMMLAAKAGVKLTLAEPGLPGTAEPSKGLQLLALSGISSVLVCLLLLLVTFMLNNTLNTPEQLEAGMHQKVLGFLNYIPEEDKDLRTIWKDKGTVPSYSAYKDLLRLLRFELTERLRDDRNVLGITSVLPGEGKTFLAGSLCYAFAMTGKNVLLISDGNESLMDLVSNKKVNGSLPRGLSLSLLKRRLKWKTGSLS